MAITDTAHTQPAARAWLAELDVRPVINASATLTALGGSLMPMPVRAAMDTGAVSFVDLHELKRKVAARIAALTHNEAAYVSSGAAGGITLTVAACMSGMDPDLIGSFPGPDGFEKNELIIHKSQRQGYDYAARMTGVKLIEIDGTAESFEAAISEHTAAVLWFAGAHWAAGALPVEEVIALGRKHNITVIVDAAAQIPAIDNLWRFTRDLGADVAIFSGGKGLRGPQSSGLVLGRKELIEAVEANGSPNVAIGRPLKVGKEELLGCLAAVEWSLAQNEDAVLAGYEATVQTWIDGLVDLPGVTAERGFPSEAGQPHARALLTIGDDAKLDRDALRDALWERNPRIAVARIGDNQIAINPQTLEPGEPEIVLRAIRDLLGA